ncbi:hypothetical protein PESHB4_07300 [Pediococcus ethanolidurans]
MILAFTNERRSAAIREIGKKKTKNLPKFILKTNKSVKPYNKHKTVSTKETLVNLDFIFILITNFSI